MQLSDGFLDALLSELFGAQPAHAALADIGIGNLRRLKKQRSDIELKRSRLVLANSRFDLLVLTDLISWF